jgi:YD repeat-containing protein
LNRPLSITFPSGGGATTYSYNDINLPFSITTSQQTSSSASISTTQVLDGMGKIGQSQNPDGSLVDVTYDSKGRTHTVSNPYFLSDSAPASTTYNYDVLDRIHNVTRQDGSSLTTTYFGNCSTVTDVTSRKTCSDALGRVTGVWEDPNGLNYETDYAYSALGNLTQVKQGSLANRVFTYDSLSQLITAYNPESGTTCYGKWSGASVGIGVCQ